MSAAQAGASILWESAGEALLQNWVTDGWWLKRPVTLECADREATGNRCTVDGGGSRMVLWIENTSGVAGPVELIGLRITGGSYTSDESGLIAAGGILILNSVVVMTDCEVDSNTGIVSNPGGSAAGGIYIEASNVELNMVSFSDNLATSTAEYHGRDIFGNTGIAVMRGCYFDGGLKRQPPNIFLLGAKGTFKSFCDAGEVGVPNSLEPPTVQSGQGFYGSAVNYAQDSSSCRPCVPGSLSFPFAEQCTLCPVGKFNELPGGAFSAACSNCTAGFYAAHRYL